MALTQPCPHMPDANSSDWRRPRTIVWALVFGLVVLAFGKLFITSFRPPDDYIADFIQEWLSARNAFAGEPIYGDQLDALARHWPEFRPQDPGSVLRFNAHPPAAVLVALPFAQLGYQDAHFAWNIVTFALFLVSIVLVARELMDRVRPWVVLCGLSILLFALPVHTSLQQGQLNFLLTFLLMVAWVADRRGYLIASGLLVGLAAGLKLFPGFVLLYFLASGRWRATVGFAIGAVGINLAALAAFGMGAFETYLRDVIPSLQQFQTGWRNLSIYGWMLRLLDPHVVQVGPEAERYPTLARLITVVASIGVVLLVVWQAWRSRRTDDPDRGWATAIVGMLLVSPITWHHYLVMLLVPLGILAARLEFRLLRVAGWVVLVVLLLGTQFFVTIGYGRQTAQLFGPAHHVPMTQRVNLLFVSLHTYALLGMLLLSIAVPDRKSSINRNER